MKELRVRRNSREAVLKRWTKGVRHGRHCVFMLHVHLVFVAKFRKQLFTKDVLDLMQETFASVCQDFEAELREFNGEGDHVHLLINYPPKVSISNLVNSLKGVSSRQIRKRDFPRIKSIVGLDSLWSPSYFAGSCGGAPLENIKEYIKNQETPD